MDTDFCYLQMVAQFRSVHYSFTICCTTLAWVVAGYVVTHIAWFWAVSLWTPSSDVMDSLSCLLMLVCWTPTGKHCLQQLFYCLCIFIAMKTCSKRMLLSNGRLWDISMVPRFWSFLFLDMSHYVQNLGGSLV